MSEVCVVCGARAQAPSERAPAQQMTNAHLPGHHRGNDGLDACDGMADTPSRYTVPRLLSIFWRPAGTERGVRGGRQPPPRGTAGRPATNVRHIGPYWPLRGPRDQALGPTCAGRPWAVVLGVIVVQIVGFQVGGTSDSWRAVSTAVGTLPLGALLAFGFAAGAASVITGWSTLGARSTRRSTET